MSRHECQRCGGPVKDDKYRLCYPCAYPEKASSGELRRVDINPDTILSRRTAIHRRVYLQVPFDEKQDAKRLGACWDAEHASWFVAPQCSTARAMWPARSNPRIRRSPTPGGQPTTPRPVVAHRQTAQGVVLTDADQA